MRHYILVLTSISFLSACECGNTLEKSFGIREELTVMAVWTGWWNLSGGAGAGSVGSSRAPAGHGAPALLRVCARETIRLWVASRWSWNSKCFILTKNLAKLGYS